MALKTESSHSSASASVAIAAADDSLIPLNAVSNAFDRVLKPKRMTILPIGHFEICVEPWLSQATDEAIEWYREHLL